jgi:hypothetical protein
VRDTLKRKDLNWLPECDITGNGNGVRDKRGCRLLI